MECSRCEDQLLTALADELSADERARFLGHVTSCPSCGVRWRQYQAVFGPMPSLLRMSETPVRDGFSSAVMARVRAEPARPRHSTVPRWFVFGRGLAAAAMAAVCVFAGLHFAHRGEESGYRVGPPQPAPSTNVAPTRASDVARVGDVATSATTAAPARAEEDAPTVGGPSGAEEPSAAEAREVRSRLEPSRALRSRSAEPAGVTAAGTPAIESPRERESGAQAPAPGGDAAGPAPHSAPAEPTATAPTTPLAGPVAAEETRDTTDDLQAESRALLMGGSGMRTGMALNHIEAVRDAQLRMENPYVTPRPQEWASAKPGLRSYRFQNVGLPFALSSIEKQGQITIVVVGHVNGTVNVSMTGVTPVEALERLADLANLQLRRIGDRRYEVRPTVTANAAGP